MTFYIDIILAENMIMNYIILFATGTIIKVNIKQTRLILASFVGSMYAIMSYISKLEIYMNQITKVLLSIVMVYIAFIPQNIKKLIKEQVIFYLTSFCFGGAAYYLLYYISPKQINNINGILRGSYPIKMAVLGGMLGFILIIISFKIVKDKFNKKLIFYDVEIGIDNKTCNLRAILDTGNLLVDPITLTSVIIVEEEKIKEIVSENILRLLLNIVNNNNYEEIPEELKKRCRFIPFSSIGKKNGMIIGIKPDYIKIYDEEDIIIRKDSIVGISNQKLSKNNFYSGLIGVDLLTKEKQILGKKVN